MDWTSLLVGILLTVVLLPVIFIVLVSVRRMVLDGKMITQLSSRYILITGCDSGFGFLLAQRLDALGCGVVASCLTEDGKKKLTSLLSSKAHVLLMDVTKEDSVKAAEEAVNALLPSPDALWGLVNNAGIMTFTLGFEFDTMKSFNKVLDVNLSGTVVTTKTFLPYLKKSKGRIINVGSEVGRLCTPGSVAYCTSKCAVMAFSDALRAELLPWGTSVHILEPGAFRTNLTDKERVSREVESYWNNAPADLREDFGDQWSEKYKKGLMKSIDMSNTNPHLVVDCMEHALLSTRPKKRYFPGYESAFGIWWFGLLPADVTDILWGLVLRNNKPAKATHC